MHCFLTLLSMALVASVASADLFDFVNDCARARFNGPSECAILYDDDGCEGWAEPIPVGYTELGYWRRNDAESVVVRKGCVFTGYDHSSPNVQNRGRSVTIDARNSPSNVYRDLEDYGSLEEEISSVQCSCSGHGIGGSGGTGGTGGHGGSGEINQRPSFPGNPSTSWIGNSGPTCDWVKFTGNTACIVYDDEDCKVDDWNAPLKYSSGQSKSFSLTGGLGNYQYKNAIESVSVRRGCALQVFKDSDFTDEGYTFRAPRDKDLHMTLERSRETQYLEDDIESLKCFC